MPLTAAPVEKELMRTAGDEHEAVLKHGPPEEPAGPSPSSDASTSRARTVHKDSEKKKFFCDNCGRMFDLRITLIRHLQDHEYQPYMCHMCERLFVKLSNLCNHRQVHFRCRVCQKQFNQKENRALPTIPPIGSVFRGAC